eukprot:CAMPEP_0119051616 /NCGR_PEP_ID=MMETSP1177-20130426/73173_1 /TAXON_ID=2985 /ORGANISM="Ochromonas sp, Strain CCMP1899" /LENGTH=498 /DNA_ID=CAMNT_0007030877 /DNA_START=47 /DNA_END=1543 /DNA_ORIENTATION=+
MKSALGCGLLAICFMVTATAQTYTNPSDPYKPSEIVNIGHSFSQNSEVTTDPNYYLYSLLLGPVIIFVLGVLSLIGLNLGLFFRCCCFCCKCLPVINPDATVEEKEARLKKHRTIILVFFYLFCLFAIIADQISWIGNVAVGKGVDNVKESITGLRMIFIELSIQAGNLVSLGVTLQANFTTANQTCPQIDNLQQFITTFKDGSKSFSDAVTGIPNDLSGANDTLDFYGVFYRNIAFYVIWALAIFSIFSMVFWQLLKKTIMLKLSMFWGMITYCLEIIVCLVFMIVTSLTAGLCSPSPSANIVRLAPKGVLRDLLTYYTSCIGTDIIGGYVTTAADAITLVKNGLDEAQNNGQCTGNAGIAAMQVDLSDIRAVIVKIRDTLVCPNLRSIWFKLVNEGLCENLYTGFYSIWISQLVTSFFVLLAILLASFAYQYFDMSYTNTNFNQKAQGIEGEYREPTVVFVASAPPPAYATTGVAGPLNDPPSRDSLPNKRERNEV